MFFSPQLHIQMTFCRRKPGPTVSWEAGRDPNVLLLHLDTTNRIMTSRQRIQIDQPNSWGTDRHSNERIEILGFPTWLAVLCFVTSLFDGYDLRSSNPIPSHAGAKALGVTWLWNHFGANSNPRKELQSSHVQSVSQPIQGRNHQVCIGAFRIFYLSSRLMKMSTECRSSW